MDKRLTPQPSELRYLAQDRVFKWVWEQLNEQFRALKPNERAKDWDDYNTRIGEQRVLAAIAKLLGDD